MSKPNHQGTKNAPKPSAIEILRNSDSRDHLINFLKDFYGQRNIKLEAEKLVELYALCFDIVEGKKDLDKERADLVKEYLNPSKVIPVILLIN